MKSVIKIINVLFFSVITFLGCTENNGEHQKDEHPASGYSEDVKLSEASIKKIGLKTEPVTLQLFTPLFKIPAKVVVNQDKEAQVGSLVQGRVYKVNVKVGDFVRAGQELMLVEGLEIGEIKADYVTAKANLDFHKANFERQKTLIAQKIGSQKSYLEAQSEYQKAAAEFDAEDKKIHSIGLKDEDVFNQKSSGEHISGTLPVKSPIDGVVVERNVVIGQLVDGTTNAFRIINTSSVWIDGQIYETDISKLGSNNSAWFTSASFPEERFAGKLTYIGQTIDERSRTITIRAEFPNTKGMLKPQMFGELHLQSDAKSKAILVPVESIINIDNTDYVFVEKSVGLFEKRKVLLGSEQDQSIEIKEGLKENEKVVVKGSFFLKSELMKEELEEDEL